jgi:hypothetical protein
MVDKDGNFYQLSDEQKAELSGVMNPEVVETREDVARLDGYLKARAEVDALKRKNHPDSQRPNSDLSRRRQPDA